MKKGFIWILPLIIGTATLLVGFGGYLASKTSKVANTNLNDMSFGGSVQPNFWKLNVNKITPLNSGWGLSVPPLISCDTIDTDVNGNFLCGSDATGAGGSGASSWEVAGTNLLTPTNTLAGIIVRGSSTIDNNLRVSGSVNATSSNIDTLSVNTSISVPDNSFALGTKTTGNYVATIADDGQSTITVNNSGSETAGVTLRVIDVACTGCVGPTEVAGLGVSDFSSANVSQWTNDAGYLTTAAPVGVNGIWETFVSNVIRPTNTSAAILINAASSTVTQLITNRATSTGVWVGTGGVGNNVDMSNDIYVQDDIEVDGTVFGNLQGNVTGNADTATNLASNPSDCSANQYANAIAASGNLTCSAISDADIPDTITASNYLLDTGDTGSGSYIFSGDARIAVLNATTTNAGTLTVYTQSSLARATSTNLAVTSLNAASCDVMADTNGSFYCGTNGSGSTGGNGAWESFGSSVIRPTNTSAAILVNAASSTITNLVSDKATSSALVVGKASYPTINMIDGDFKALRATTSNLTVTSLNAASCDLKADTSGNFYCGTDANSGGGGGAAWHATSTTGFLSPSITPTTTNASIVILGTATTTKYAVTSPSFGAQFAQLFHDGTDAYLTQNAGQLILGNSANSAATIFDTGLIDRSTSSTIPFLNNDTLYSTTTYITNLIIGGDTITELVGTGLTLSGSDLQTTLGTAITSSEITDGEVAEADLKVVDSPSDEDIFTYESTTGDFEWHSISDLGLAKAGVNGLWETFASGVIRPTNTTAGILVVSASSTIVNLRVPDNLFATTTLTDTLTVGGRATITLDAWFSGNLRGQKATTTNLGVTSLAVASCDVKATANGDLYCGTDATASGAPLGINGAWESFGTNVIRPTNTSAAILVNAASSTITNLVVSGNLHATTSLIDTLNLTNNLAVANGGTGASTLTDGGVLVGSGTGAITALSVGTNGQLLVGSTGADPVFATLNCAGNLTCTTGAGTLQIDVDDSFLLNTGDTGTGSYIFSGDARIATLNATTTNIGTLVVYTGSTFPANDIVDAEVSDTLTASDLVAGSAVVADSEVVDALTINTSIEAIYTGNIRSNHMNATSTNVGTLRVYGGATSTNLAVLGMTAANCDVKATTDGVFYCGTDSGGAGSDMNSWEILFTNALTPTSSSAGIFVKASSTFDSTLRINGLATSTIAHWIGSGGVANGIDLQGGDLYVQGDVEIDGILGTTGSRVSEAYFDAVDTNQITIGGDTITEFAGSGLTVSGNALTVTGKAPAGFNGAWETLSANVIRPTNTSAAILVNAASSTVTNLVVNRATTTDALTIPNGASPYIAGSAARPSFDTSSNNFLFSTSSASDFPIVYGMATSTLAGFVATTSPIVSGGTKDIAANNHVKRVALGIVCKVTSGTSLVLNLSDDGTNDTNTVTCDTTLKYYSFTSNNTFNAYENWRLEFGTKTGDTGDLVGNIVGYRLSD